MADHPHKKRTKLQKKVAKVTREEKAKPKGKRRSRAAIFAKAKGTLEHQRRKT